MAAIRVVHNELGNTTTHQRGRHSDAPLLSALQECQSNGTVPLSTPGHKRRPSLAADIQRLPGSPVFDADVWLNMSDLEDALQNAEDLAADAWGADSAHFLVNGSSSGNIALLQAQLQPGDEVIVARDAHQSMLTGLIVTGAKPVFVAPRLHPTLDHSIGVHPDDIESALEEHPRARMVVITCPTYNGVVSDVAAISRVAHQRDLPLFVDQAWGAHLRFHPVLPTFAMDAGADATVISPHMTLSSLSNGSMLLVRGSRINRTRLRSAIGMTQSTSRNLPILVSLDSTRRQMATQGWALMELTLALAIRAKARLREIPGIDVIDGEMLGLESGAFDPTRLVIDTRGIGLDGFTAERMLRKHFGISPEMSDCTGIICLITIGDSRESVDALVEALSSLAMVSLIHDRTVAQSRCRSTGKVIAPGEMALTPREAYFARSRAVPLPVAIGEISAELVVPYPPGIPVLTPGERISWEKLMYLAEISRRGAQCTGAADPRLLTLRVVDA